MDALELIDVSEFFSCSTFTFPFCLKLFPPKLRFYHELRVFKFKWFPVWHSIALY